MNSAIRILVFSFLTLVFAANIWAQTHVPRYLAYQMNGVYYFYCTSEADCGGGGPSMKTSNRMHVFGCDTSQAPPVPYDPIIVPPTHEGLVDKTPKGLRVFFQLDEDIMPVERLETHALTKKGGKGLRLVKGPDDIKRVAVRGTVMLATKSDEVWRDLEYTFDDDDGVSRYFRVMQIHSSQTLMAGMESNTFFAQEIAAPQGTPKSIISRSFPGGGTVGKIVVKVPEDTDPQGNELPPIARQEIHALAVDPVP